MYELRSAARPTTSDARGWIGKRVDDIHGKPIGRLSEVIADPSGGDLDWLLVRYGPGGDACTLIPLREAAQASRRIWVRFSKDFVRNGPWIHRHTPLSVRTGAEFARHYGLPVTSMAPAPKPKLRARRFAGPRPAAVSATQLAMQR